MRSITIRGLALTAVASLALGGVAVACGGSGEKSEGTTTEKPTTGGGSGGGSGNATAGKALFAQTCASCHGQDAKGLPKLGKDLTASTFLKGLSDPEAVAFVTKGRDTSDPANTTGVAMPPKGGNPALTSQKLADIIAYLRTLEK